MSSDRMNQWQTTSWGHKVKSITYVTWFFQYIFSVYSEKQWGSLTGSYIHSQSPTGTPKIHLCGEDLFEFASRSLCRHLLIHPLVWVYRDRLTSNTIVDLHSIEPINKLSNICHGNFVEDTVCKIWVSLFFYVMVLTNVFISEITIILYKILY